MKSIPEINIRFALPNDISAIVGMLKMQLDEHNIPISVDRLSNAVKGVFKDDNRGILIVAETPENSIGVAYVSFVWTLEHGGPGAWLEEMFVKPEWRNKGIGTKMLNMIMRECAKRGCNGIDLEVDSIHSDAENLYSRFGFEPLDRNRWSRKLSNS